MQNFENVWAQAKKEFIADCRDDWPAELWSLLWLIRYHINGGHYPTKGKDVSNTSDVRQIALGIIEELLSEGQVEAVFTNYPTTNEYRLELAKQPVPEIMARIRKEWEELGREPNMAQIVAFAPKGAMQHDG